MSATSHPLSSGKHPVDQVLPLPQMALYGLQHVLSMYAGVVAVPLIVGSALKLSRPEITYLVVRGPVHLRPRHAVADPRYLEDRRPPADRARHVVRRRLDHPGHRDQGRRHGRAARPSSAHSCCRRVARLLHRASVHPATPLLPRGGHRHRDHGDRHVAVAGGDPLGRRRCRQCPDFGAPKNIALALITPRSS